jgi:vacuolar-type H+-ATPase subunit I/STV1
MKKLYQTAWWEKLFKKEEKKKKEDPLALLEAIKDFVGSAFDQVHAIKPLLNELEELEKERKVTNKELLKINLEAQAEVYEKLLDKYEFFQDDCDINGLRLKQLSRDFLDSAKHAGLNDLVKEKLKTQKWKWGW